MKHDQSAVRPARPCTALVWASYRRGLAALERKLQPHSAGSGQTARKFSDSLHPQHGSCGRLASGVPLTSLHCRVLPPASAMLLAPEMKDAPGGSLSGVEPARHPYLPELQSTARSGQDWV